MNGLTAMQILDLTSLRPGQTIAVTGAAGTLGNPGVELFEERLTMGSFSGLQ